MAKKKSDTGSSEQKQQTPAKKSATAAAAPTPASAAAPAGKKPAASASSKPAARPAAAPAIDTSLAANAAAAMIGNKAAGAAATARNAQPQKPESSAFKQLKAGLNKPAAGALGGAFGIGAKQQKKTTQNYGGGKQVGHNQTFGSDVNRAGVPRRTPG
jgi:hypothetical protein